MREFLQQFKMIARANSWNDLVKAIQLAAHLRGKARSVLDSWNEGMTYSELKNRLELKFGDRQNFQNAYTQFSNRKQKPGEDFAAFGEDLERLARSVYPECPAEVHDKISCAQFISVLSDGFIRQTLQLENVKSLRPAIERAITVQIIQRTNFPRKNDSLREHKFEPLKKKNITMWLQIPFKKRRVEIILKNKIRGGQFPVNKHVQGILEIGAGKKILKQTET